MAFDDTRTEPLLSIALGVLSVTLFASHVGGTCHGLLASAVVSLALFFLGFGWWLGRPWRR